MIYWFTGQPGSGKTTLAQAWAQETNGIFLDGDTVRQYCRPLPDPYSKGSRSINVDRMQAIAAYARLTGCLCVACVSPFRDQREDFKKFTDVTEIYCHCEEQRKPPEYMVDYYEPPLDDYIDFDTDKMSVEDCLSTLRSIHSL